MAAERLDDRYAGSLQRLAEIRRRSDPVAEVVLVDDLAEALRDRLQVAAGEAAVRREALGEDQEVPALLGEGVVVEREPAADVRQAILLRGHRHAVGEGRHLADDVRDRAVGLPGLAELDEPGVLGEPAGVEEQRHAVAVADRPNGPEVLERDGLAAAGVVGDRDEHDGHVRAARSASSRSSAATSMLPLNGWTNDGSRPSGITRSTASAPRASTFARVVSKWVLFGTTLARAAEDGEQDLLGGAALVGRDDVAEWEEALDRSRGRRTTMASRRSSRRRAGWPPTGRATSRRCQNRSAGRSGRRRRGG